MPGLRHTGHDTQEREVGRNSSYNWNVKATYKIRVTVVYWAQVNISPLS